MQGRTTGVLAAVVFGLAMVTSMAHAKAVPYDYLSCFSGTTTVVSASKELTVLGFEMHGVNLQSQIEDKRFEDMTFHCAGVSRAGDAPGANGYCKTMSPDGDFFIGEFSRVGPAVGGKNTWKAVYGTGKWQGITGGGTWERITTKSKGITQGTFQNCNRVTGTYTLPD